MKVLEDQAFNLRDEGRVYLDHNATTPLAAELVPLINKWTGAWGNPSSIHFNSRGPKALMREARTNVAALIGASSLEIIFTSGGSESNNLVLKGVLGPWRRDLKRDTLIISSVEHPSVEQTAQHLQSYWGIKVIRIPVCRDGELDFEFYEKSLSERVALVSVMAANNETGHLFPIQKMAKAAHAVGALFHSDGVQMLGKMPVDVKKWDVDFASFAGHKFYSLKGCGFLYAKKGNRMESLIHGGGQERHRRAGTENTLAIASMGHMAKKKDLIPQMYEVTKALRDSMEGAILASIDGVHVTGDGGKRLPNSSNMIIDGVDGETLLMNLDLEGFSVSTGAACSSGNPEPSPVLLAMGLTRREAQNSLRISLGWGTTQDDLDRFVQALQKVVKRIRGFSEKREA